jgi:co-chaperonin GroES (HSP10)
MKDWYRSYQMQNNSGIYPKGHRVLVMPFAVEEKTKSGIIISTATEKRREEMAQMEGILISIGNTAWADVKEPFANVGDRVMFAKFAGILKTGKDGVEYRILNDLEIVATLDNEEEENV